VPLVRFELTNQRFFHTTYVDRISRTMSFDAKIDADNAIRVDGAAIQHVNVQLVEGERPFGDGTTEHVGRLVYFDWNDEPSVTCYACLPDNSFDAVLSADTGAYAFTLTFEAHTDVGRIMEGKHRQDGFRVSPTGDGVTWDFRKENPVVAESISLGIVPLARADADESPPPSNAKLAQQVVQEIRRLTWTVVILGIIVTIQLA
jgi:hypothetical protein